ncbi:hypothetical protein D3C84_445190 [compost metagenome]
MSESIFDRPCDHVTFLVNVAQTMSFVQHNQMPAHALDVIGFGFGELIGANDRPVGFEWLTALLA